MPDVAIGLSDSSYTVRVEPGILKRAGRELRALSKSNKVIIVTDETVGPLFLPTLVQAVRATEFEPIVATLPCGEHHKTLKDMLPLYDLVLSNRIERSTPLLALGGGIVGDMAGFAAATLLRGIPYIQIPTTLLAMVDSSIGGKTGVNHAVGKNQIGAFHQPLAVLADPSVLSSLPDAELIAGLAECIKHEIIRDTEGFSALEKNLDTIFSREASALTNLVVHNVVIKARVVESDPLELGERAHLNFGHTFAQAIENASDHAYSHGQAVGLGMVAAANLAVELGLLDRVSRDRIVKLIGRAGLLTTNADLDADKVLKAMAFDKKVTAKKIRFIVPDRIGHVVIRDDVPPELVLKAIQTIVKPK